MNPTEKERCIYSDVKNSLLKRDKCHVLAHTQDIHANDEVQVVHRTSWYLKTVAKRIYKATAYFLKGRSFEGSLEIRIKEE